MTESAIPTQLADNDVIHVDNLSVRFAGAERTVDAVKNLSFHVGRGETLAIVGESGSGKSVTSLALMRLVEYGGGRIINGSMTLRRRDSSLVDLSKADSKIMRSVRGADMAMIFQEPMTSLNPVFTAGDQIAESIRLHQQASAAQARAETLRLLEQVRIPEAKSVMDRYPHQLSGGMRQRVMIAMALACKPALLIADEPTTALDVTVQAQILQLISQLQQEMQMGVIFITHDMGVVAEVADRVLVMYKGEKVEEGESTKIFATPQHPYTQALLAAVPRLGSMHDTDLPARFALVSPEQNAAQTSEKAGVKIENHPSTDGGSLILPYRDQAPILSVRNLITRFDLRGGILNRVQRRVHAVEKVSFDLFPGETLALVGESGCGKSTTGRSLLRLVDIQGGQITFDGQDVLALKHQQLQSLRRDIQFVFQDPFASLDPRLTVGYSIMEPLLIHKVCSPAEARERVGQLLDRVGLSREMARRYPHEFSGGQRQRVCIARALALNPKVVIADESVSALDVSIQAQIINLLIDLQKELGVAFLFISHDMAVVERISHRVAVMYLGQIVEIGPRREIFQNPQHPYTRKLMSAVPIADPTRRHQKRVLDVDELPSPIRGLNDDPLVAPLVQVGPDHYVARHQIGGVF
ncbi:glutathione transport system ATP-binding protein [Jezberella montanilacus]|jgi:glutathione transport system ATP-binding protein|uniref:Glutathione import ATP-binding protein GsiA n=1 Tax=Jezberella montanilacus TaxID=323426 RepID=A0A2T0XEY5_9BURK|nr:dipeptide ABC transporter ATP-binding protein [Jezberella montanilacus]PRY97496.1 glutathione transport system ATP-binding protein [Jezberella montanilacus]